MAVLLAMSAPAFARSSVGMPEPTDIVLFGLAIAGVVIGRRSSKAPPYDKNNDA